MTVKPYKQTDSPETNLLFLFHFFQSQELTINLLEKYSW